jgi:hypothetical protein
MTQYKHLESIETLCCEEVGNGVFYISKLPNQEQLIYTFKDKYGYFNVCHNMEEMTKYLSGEECVCEVIEDEYFEEDDARYEEGVDALDIYLNSVVEEGLK